MSADKIEKIENWKGKPCACGGDQKEVYICLKEDCPMHGERPFFCQLCMENGVHQHFPMKNIPTHISELVTKWKQLAQQYSEIANDVYSWDEKLWKEVREYDSELLASQGRDLSQARWISIDVDTLEKSISNI